MKDAERQVFVILVPLAQTSTAGIHIEFGFIAMNFLHKILLRRLDIAREVLPALDRPLEFTSIVSWPKSRALHNLKATATCLSCFQAYDTCFSEI